MIVVRIQIYPGGDATKAYEAGLIVIANDGAGTPEIGHYVYSISHTGRHLKTKKGSWKDGTVRNFKRKTNNVYSLLRRVLASARF